MVLLDHERVTRRCSKRIDVGPMLARRFCRLVDVAFLVVVGGVDVGSSS